MDSQLSPEATNNKHRTSPRVVTSPALWYTHHTATPTDFSSVHTCWFFINTWFFNGTFSIPGSSATLSQYLVLQWHFFDTWFYSGTFSILGSSTTLFQYLVLQWLFLSTWFFSEIYWANLLIRERVPAERVRPVGLGLVGSLTSSGTNKPTDLRSLAPPWVCKESL